MSIISTRPPIAFSSNFNTTTAGIGSFSSKDDRDTYLALKTEIQKVFLDSVISSAEIKCIDNVPPASISKTRSGVLYLSQVALDRIVDRVAARGFNITFEKNGKESGHLNVSVGSVDKDESGYVSDGWDENFKASIQREKVKQNDYTLYKEATQTIEKLMADNPDLYVYECPINNKTILSWIMEDLQSLGFEVNDDYRTLTITKPNPDFKKSGSLSLEELSINSPQEENLSPVAITKDASEITKSTLHHRITWGHSNKNI